MPLLLSMQLNILTSSNVPELVYQVYTSSYFKCMETQCKFKSKLSKLNINLLFFPLKVSVSKVKITHGQKSCYWGISIIQIMF